jgi:hypothetical protein
MSTIDFDQFDIEGLSLEEMEPVKKAETVEETESEKIPEIKAEAVRKSVAVDTPLNADAERTEASSVEGSMTCPKCELEQPKAEQCSGCGVYVKKAQAVSPSKIQITSTKF